MTHFFLNHPPEPNSVSMKMEAAHSSKTPKQTYYSTHCNNPNDHHCVWHLYKTIHHSLQKWLLAWFTIMQQFKYRNVFRTKYHIRESGL